eukprot:2217968-Pleurochrysis_carterae.AAC.3
MACQERMAYVKTKFSQHPSNVHGFCLRYKSTEMVTSRHLQTFIGNSRAPVPLALPPPVRDIATYGFRRASPALVTPATMQTRSYMLLSAAPSPGSSVPFLPKKAYVIAVAGRSVSLHQVRRVRERCLRGYQALRAPRGGAATAR